MEGRVTLTRHARIRILRSIYHFTCDLIITTLPQFLIVMKLHQRCIWALVGVIREDNHVEARVQLSWYQSWALSGYCQMIAVHQDDWVEHLLYSRVILNTQPLFSPINLSYVHILIPVFHPHHTHLFFLFSNNKFR